MLLLILITSGCKTTQIESVFLPPKPEREILPAVVTVEDYAETIIYYETLVQKWEAWGDTVEKIIEQEDTE